MRELLERPDADAQFGIVELCTGKTENGEDFFAYVNIHPSRYQAYLKAQQQKAVVNFDEFGDVLHMGIGTTMPSSQVRNKLLRKFKIDFSVAETLEKDARQLQAE